LQEICSSQDQQELVVDSNKAKISQII